MVHFLKIKNRIFQNALFKQISRFLIVGSGSTIISYSTFFIALRFFEFHYLIANICGFIPGVIFNYYLNRRWSFNFQEKDRFFKYLILYLSSLALTSILLWLFVESFKLLPEIANIVTIILVTLVNFLGVKFVVFREKS
jgi:putative flippase GtrA